MKKKKKNMKTKTDVFKCHFLADRARWHVGSLVYEYFVFSPTKPRFGSFRRFSRFRPYANVLRIQNTLYHPYIESTIVLSDYIFIHIIYKYASAS